MKPFADRTDAGKQLAHKLHRFEGQDVIVLALPRGGVPVAFEIAKALHAPLEVFVVRKLGTPGQEELAMGAIASGGVRILNQDVIQSIGIDERMLDQEIEKEQTELQRRETLYRGSRTFPSLQGKPVIVVDDGIATGASMRSAVEALKQLQPAKIIVAAPTCAREAYTTLQQEADEVICLAIPEPYIAVGIWYGYFPQTSDDEVKALLKKANDRNES
jgi:putative phosphoribosyl transferase